MKIFEIEEYIEYLDYSEQKYFLEISHTNGLSLYQINNISKAHSKTIIRTFVKDEIKIWMDLMGYNLLRNFLIKNHCGDKFEIRYNIIELSKVS